MKQQMRLSILVLITLTFLGGCKVKKKDEDVAAANVVTTNQQEQVIDSVMYQDIRIEYVGQKSPSLYSAVVSWPVTKTLSTFRILDSKNTNIETAANSITLENLKGGAESKIMFEQYSMQDQKRLASFDVIISPPQDFIFDGVVSLTENVDKTVERLFLTSSSRVYTNQFNLSIKAKYIYSEFGALITNFPEGSKAPTGVVGLSGGKVELQSDYADGNLQIIMNAQRGGDGKLGIPKEDVPYINIGQPSPGDQVGIQYTIPECLGGSGSSAGQAGTFIFSATKKNDFKISSRMVLASGGSRGQTEIKCKYPNAAFLDFDKNNCLQISGVDRFKCNQNFVSADGQPSQPGQICTKMNPEENYKCTNY